jgi:hypothetical protein
MGIPVDPRADREAKNRQEGLAFAHKMGLHQGNPDPSQGGCISCFKDRNNHSMFHTKNNADPKCAYCPPKRK